MTKHIHQRPKGKSSCTIRLETKIHSKAIKTIKLNSLRRLRKV